MNIIYKLYYVQPKPNSGKPKYISSCTMLFQPIYTYLQKSPINSWLEYCITYSDFNFFRDPIENCTLSTVPLQYIYLKAKVQWPRYPITYSFLWAQQRWIYFYFQFYMGCRLSLWWMIGARTILIANKRVLLWVLLVHFYILIIWTLVSARQSISFNPSVQQLQCRL